MIKKNILSKKSLFGDFRTKEDFVLWLKILKKDIKIYSFRVKFNKMEKKQKTLYHLQFYKSLKMVLKFIINL